MTAQLHAHADPGEALARRALGLDAAWCAAAAAVAVVASGPLGRTLAVPAPVVAGAGMVTGAWAGVVGLWSVAEDWRGPTGRVAGVNVVAAAGLVGLAATRPRRSGRTLAALLSVQVGGFAVAQMRAIAEDAGGTIRSL